MKCLKTEYNSKIFNFFGCNKILFTEEMRDIRKTLSEKIVYCL